MDKSIEKEIRELCSAAFNGKPFNLSRFSDLYHLYTPCFKKIVWEEYEKIESILKKRK